jgi:hypothetical protein
MENIKKFIKHHYLFILKDSSYILYDDYCGCTIYNSVNFRLRLGSKLKGRIKLINKDKDEEISAEDFMRFININCCVNNITFNKTSIDVNHNSYFYTFKKFNLSYIVKTEARKMIQPWLDLIHTCVDDNDAKMFLVNFFAKIVKFPGIRTEIIISLCSEQGAGKNRMFAPFETMMCKNYCCSELDITKIGGRFESTAMKDLILGVFNEAPNVRSITNRDERLKALITDPTIRVEPKGKDPYFTFSGINFMCFTNSARPFMVQADDRRNVSSIDWVKPPP